MNNEIKNNSMTFTTWKSLCQKLGYEIIKDEILNAWFAQKKNKKTGVIVIMGSYDPIKRSSYRTWVSWDSRP